MLPDLALPIVLGEELAYLIARDVPVALFYDGYPATPGAATRLDWERWADGLLTRVVLAPALTTELVQRLGGARDMAFRAYVRAVGFAAGTDGPPAEPSLIVGALPLVARVLLESLPRLPEGLVRDDLLAISDRWSIPPWVIWSQWPISAFLFTLRMLTPALPAHVAEARSSELVGLVGCEPERR